MTIACVRTRSRRLMWMSFAALALVTSVVAAAAPRLVSTLTAREVVGAPGHEQFQPASTARPGDVVEYRATYRNAGTSAVNNLTVNLPVPAGTTLLAGSVRPAGASATTDGVHFSAMPLMRVVKLRHGRSKREVVPLAEIHALRWTIGSLSPGQAKSVEIRVRINGQAAQPRH